MVDEIKTQEKFDEALSNEGIVVVYFFSNSSESCEDISLSMDEWSIKYGSVKFIKVDIDQCHDIAKKHDISTVPYFYFYIDGELGSQLDSDDPEAIEVDIKAYAQRE